MAKNGRFLERRASVLQVAGRLWDCGPASRSPTAAVRLNSAQIGGTTSSRSLCCRKYLAQIASMTQMPIAQGFARGSPSSTSRRVPNSESYRMGQRGQLQVAPIVREWLETFFDALLHRPIPAKSKAITNRWFLSALALYYFIEGSVVRTFASLGEERRSVHGGQLLGGGCASLP